MNRQPQELNAFNGTDTSGAESKTTQGDEEQLKHVTKRWVRPVDLDAFRTLVDRADEAFLRKNLPRAEFFRLKRLRIRVIWKYVRRISDNSEMVLKKATTVWRFSDLSTAKAAREVADVAWRVNAQCLIAFAKLAVEYMFPAICVRVPLRRGLKR